MVSACTPTPPPPSSASSAWSPAADPMIISGLQGQVESSWLSVENGGGGGGGRSQWVSSRKTHLGNPQAAWQTHPPGPDQLFPGTLAAPSPTAPAVGVTPQQIGPTVPRESNWTRSRGLLLCCVIYYGQPGRRRVLLCLQDRQRSSLRTRGSSSAVEG